LHVNGGLQRHGHGRVTDLLTDGNVGEDGFDEAEVAEIVLPKIQIKREDGLELREGEKPSGGGMPSVESSFTHGVDPARFEHPRQLLGCLIHARRLKPHARVSLKPFRGVPLHKGSECGVQDTLFGKVMHTLSEGLIHKRRQRRYFLLLFNFLV